MEMVAYSIPRVSAVYFASSMECCDENRDGMEIPSTFSGPTASAATQAATAESIPPLSPRTMRCTPDF